MFTTIHVVCANLDSLTDHEFCRAVPCSILRHSTAFATRIANRPESMNKYIERLYHIGNKSRRKILGLMSGTSLDGLDIALCDIQYHGQQTLVRVERFITIEYDVEFRLAIQQVFARRDVDLQEVTLLNGWVADYHATLINQALSDWQIDAEEIDCIASHGQTIFHCPKEQHGLPDYGNGTLQIGDGDRLATSTGIITLSDFRQKHIAAGGEGAPLAVYGDYLVFGSETENRVLLNIGGIANFTWLPAGQQATNVFSTDIGPGNTILDAFVSKHFSHLRFDKNGEIAARGTVSEPLLQELMRYEFFNAPVPKTTGPEVFNLDYLHQARLYSQTLGLSTEDVVATLTAFTAKAIANGITDAVESGTAATVYLSGGGVHNPALTAALEAALPDTFAMKNLGELGIDPDAKEALLFAILANETLAGSPCFEGNRYGIPNTTMGKISLP